MPANTNKRPKLPEGEVGDWAKQLPAEFLLCRDLGHQWTPYRAWEDRPNRAFVQVLLCTRCRAERHRELNYRGERVTQ